MADILGKSRFDNSPAKNQTQTMWTRFQHQASGSFESGFSRGLQLFREMAKEFYKSDFFALKEEWNRPF